MKRTKLESFLKDCKCEKFLENFLDEDISLKDLLDDIDEVDDLIDYIDNENLRKKCFSHLAELRKFRSNEPPQVKKLKQFLEKCKCQKLVDIFMKNNILYDQLANLSEQKITDLIKKTLLRKKFLRLQRSVFNKCDISIDEVVKVAKKHISKDLEKKLNLYIMPRGSLDIDGGEKDMFQVFPAVNEFLKDKKQKVLLLLGEGGSGKSLFMQYLQLDRIKNGKNSRVPLFIRLTSVENPCKGLLMNHLMENLCLGKKEARYVKNNYPLLLILDGLDEVNVKYRRNLYRSNLFETLPNATKIIISCRTASLFHFSGKSNHKELFAPIGENGFEFNKLKQIVIRPFSAKNIKEFVNKFVKSKESNKNWSVDKYLIEIKKGNLTELFKNPFLLYVGLKSLSSIVKDQQSSGSAAASSAVKLNFITRYDLFESFINKWFNREKGRLMNSKENVIEQRKMREFCENISIHMLAKQINTIYFTKEMFDENYIDENELSKDEIDWIKKFQAIRKDFNVLNIELFDLISSCPLYKVGDMNYQFIHRSFWEYIIASIIIREMKHKDVEKRAKCLNIRLLNNEDSVVKFVSDFIRGNDSESIRSKFLDIVLLSKTKKEFSVSSANASTMLNHSFFSFSGRDLSGVDISGADLTHSILCGTNFKNSNLSNVKLRRSILTGCNFEGCNLSGCYFGEYPKLVHERKMVVLEFEGLGDLFFDDGDKIQFSNCGKFIASSSEGKLYIWDSKTSKLIEKFTSGNCMISWLSWHPDPSLILLASVGDKTCQLWDGKNKFKCIELETFSQYSKCRVLSWHPNSSEFLLASSGDENDFIILNGKDNYKVKKIEAHSEVRRISWHPNTSMFTLATGSEDGAVQIWTRDGDLKYTNKKIEELSVNGCVFGLSWNNSTSLLLAACGRDNFVRVWDGKKSIKLEGHTNSVCCVSWHPDASLKLLASCSRDKTIRIWDLKDDLNYKCLILKGHSKTINYISWHPDSSLFLLSSCGNDRRIHIWDGSNEYQSTKLEGHSEKVNRVLWFPDKSVFKLLSESDDNTVRIWDANIIMNSSTSKAEGHSSNVNCVVWHPDPSLNLLASASDDNSIRIWDESCGYKSFKLEGHSNKVNCLSWHRYSLFLASGSDDNTIRIWNVETLSTLKIIKSKSSVKCVSWLQKVDRFLLASGSAGHVVRVWNGITGELLCVLREHTDAVTCLDWHPDPNNRLLAAGGMDNRIVIWDLKNNKVTTVGDNIPPKEGNERKDGKIPYISIGSSIFCLSWNPDKSLLLLATGGYSSNIDIWDGKQNYKKVETHCTGSGEVFSIDWHPKKNLIASANEFGVIAIVDCEKKNYLTLGGMFPFALRGVSWHPNPSKNLLSFCSLSNYVRVDKLDQDSKGNFLHDCIFTSNSFLHCEFANFSKSTLSSSNLRLMEQNKAKCSDVIEVNIEESKYNMKDKTDNSNEMNNSEEMLNNSHKEKVKKFAFIVGNSSYEHITKLKNPKYDVSSINKVFQSLGFVVHLKTDVDSEDLVDDFDCFCTTIAEEAKNRNFVAVVFLSGHGVYSPRTDSEFFLPIDIEKEDFEVKVRKSKNSNIIDLVKNKEKEIGTKCLTKTQIEYSISILGGVGIYFFDACRSLLTISIKESLQKDKNVDLNDVKEVGNIANINPMSDNLQLGKERGLKIVDLQKSGSKRFLWLFSTRRLNVAYDGKEKNSPFTQALIVHLKKRDSLFNIFRRIEDDVRKKTNNMQNPKLDVESMQLLNLEWPLK